VALAPRHGQKARLETIFSNNGRRSSKRAAGAEQDAV
jgi:hypothetical protein